AAMLAVVLRITINATAPPQPADAFRRLSDVTLRGRQVWPESSTNPSLGPRYASRRPHPRGGVLSPDSGSRTPAICRAAPDLDSALLRRQRGRQSSADAAPSRTSPRGGAARDTA